MQLTNTRERYGRVAQGFHWTIAALFLVNYPIAFVAHDWPRDTGERVAFVATLFSWHKTIGVTVFALAVLRVAWALMNPRPRLLNAEKRLEAFAASTIHWVLYAAILLLPLAGMVIHWSSVGFAPLYLPFPDHIGLVPSSERVAAVAAVVHKALALAILAAIALHVAGALKHHFVDRDQTLIRMLPFRRPVGLRVPPRAWEPNHAATAALGLGALLLVGGTAGAVAGWLNRGETVQATIGAEPPATLATAEPLDPVAADANAWVVDPAASTLSVAITQLGSEVVGEFARWDAAIRHDPADPAASSVRVTVDLDSLSLGTVTDQAKGAEFLDAVGAPEAVFEANGFVPAGDGAFTADGTLALRGTEAPASLLFDLAIEGDAAEASGTATLDRLDWGVGAEGYPDGSSVGLDVTVTFDLRATRAGSGAAADAAPGS